MNLAIVLSVSSYVGDAPQLPACEADGSAVYEMLVGSGQFQDVLMIGGGEPSTSVKDKIINFAKSHAGSEVDHLLFYFSGHGLFQDSEFYYVLSDFRHKALRQTSLENTELDSILRSISPRLCVKIVDACQSGMTYIKDSGDINTYISKGTSAFKNLYFMFSSTTEQSSYADRKMSFFTRSIVEAVARSPSNGLRYKEIIDYVSDDFAGSGFQTPIFVTQADFTEIFIPVSPELQAKLKAFLAEDKQLVVLPGKDKQSTLAERIKADSERYRSKAEVVEKLAAIPDLVEQSFAEFSDLTQIFDVSINEENTSPPNSRAIGEWISQNKGDGQLFAKPTYKTETFRERVRKRRGGNFMLTPFSTNSLSSNYWTFHDDDDDGEEPKYVTKVRTVVDGVEHTTDMPYSTIRVRLDAKYPNLTPEECYFAPIVSQTHLRLFYAFAHFQMLDWDRFSRTGSVSWHTAEVVLGDEKSLKDLIKMISERFSEFVREPLTARFEGRLSESSADADPPAPSLAPAPSEGRKTQKRST